MKVNRKAVLSTATVLGVAALVAGGTIAYFTDKEATDNHFTVGSVDITLYESQLHRENSGRAGTFYALASDPNYCDWNRASATDVATYFGNASLIAGSYNNARYCTPNMAQNTFSDNADDITAVKNGHTAANRGWGFTDDVIKADADTYKDSVAEGDAADGYFTTVAKNIVPGEWVRKFTYVTNDGKSDAYVLIRYMIPAEYAGKVTLKVPGTPYEEDVHADLAGHQGYFTALTKSGGKYVAFDSSAKDSMDNYHGYPENIGGVDYIVYAAVTTDVVNPGEMTFWSPINTVALNAGEEQTKNVTTGGVSYPLSAIDVKVDAQAIQARTFGSAVEAINAGNL